MMKKLIVATVVLMGSMISFWIYTHSFIEIDVNTSSGTINYTLHDQSANREQNISSTNKKVRRLVRRGGQEVLVKSEGKSYFVVTKSGGFLSTKKVQADLKEEKSRSFVGDNPNSCMNYVGSTLISFSCDGPFEQLRAHLPASPDTPTYTKNISSASRWTVGGTASTKTGVVLLLRAIKQGDESAAHVAFILNDTESLKAGLVLNDLNKDKFYDIQPYKEGFIVYDQTFSDVYYYSSLSSKPQKISLEAPKDKSLKPYILSAGESIMVAYSNSTEEHVFGNDIDAPTRIDSASEIVIQSDSKVSHYSFSERFSSTVLCGNNKLCALLDNQLSVYDISDDSQKHLFGVENIDAIESLGMDLLIVRKKEILRFDVEARSGSVDYSLAGYTFCGFHKETDSYTICLVNNRGSKSALKIGPGLMSGDDIDKKLTRLFNVREIKNISTYSKFIYISPDYGQLKRSPSGFFEIDPEKKNIVDKQINTVITESGIDVSKYLIINTLD